MPEVKLKEKHDKPWEKNIRNMYDMALITI